MTKEIKKYKIYATDIEGWECNEIIYASSEEEAKEKMYENEQTYAYGSITSIELMEEIA